MQVNATLDCDTPGACFQHSASILVLDGGQPQMTTCVPRTFRVREDAGPHTLLGSVVGTDMDYPRNSLQYYISGGPSTFAVHHLSGELHLLGPLDYEQQRLYKIIILLIDHGQDWDLNSHRSGSCTMTIEVEDVNDHAPECEPPFQELTIYTPLSHSMEVTKVSCWIPQEPQRSTLSYSIVGGNSQSRFRLQGTILVYNDTVLGPPWPEQPCTYELLIHVADVGPSIPHLSTTATIIVHLVPWKASTVATSTHQSTGCVLSNDTPDCDRCGGFLEARALVCGSADSNWCSSPPGSGLAPRQDPSGVGPVTTGTEQTSQSSVAKQVSLCRARQHFDGRAQDVRRDYLFSSLTGARRWL
ncbi:Cadherin-related family member 4 [Apodemus speciosus]|uniref:Cadherin-related family member 4 n=1 Tax=Apodemus speciosus TaxID=105296 RepID=A0ABQ0F6K2_APOSI